MSAPLPPAEEVDLENAERPIVPSPYAGRKINALEQIAISAFWFATNFLWGALIVIMLPAEMKAMAPAYKATALGWLSGLASIVALVVPLVVGALSDRCTSRLGRRRPFIITGVAINLMGLALMLWAFTTRVPISGAGNLGYWGAVGRLLTSSTFVLFLLAYMFVQLGNNIATAAYSGVIPDLVPENQRGRASGYMALMSQLGTLLGALVCGQVLTASEGQTLNHSESMRYIAVALVLAAVTLITIVGIRENPLTVRPPKIVWKEYIKSLWIDPKKYPDFAWVWITRALVMLGFYSVVPYINYYLTDVVHIPDNRVDAEAGYLIAVILLTSSISGILGGYLSDRIGRKKVVYIANGCIAFMSIFFIFCHTIPQTMLVGSLFGLGFGAYTSVDWALGTDVLPTKNNAAKEMAVWHIAMTLPQAFAAPLAGGLIQHFGVTRSTGAEGTVVHYTLAGYSAMFILCSVCFALGAYLLKNVRRAT